MGDPGKLIILEEILNVIKRQDLLSVVQKTGNKLKSGLLDIEKEFPYLVNSVRGRGTFLAINAVTNPLRDGILAKLKQKGKFSLNTIKIITTLSFMIPIITTNRILIIENGNSITEE